MSLSFRSVHCRLAIFGSHLPAPACILIALMVLLVGAVSAAQSQTIILADKSVARNWNEVLLDAIRRDFARPTVHARNLFHTSAAMYDAWAFYDNTADTFLLGETVANYTCALSRGGRRRMRNMTSSQRKSAREVAMSFAMYRLLSHRFSGSPGQALSQFQFDTLMQELGLDIDFTSTDYRQGSAAALGNYIAQCYIEFGLQDGSNEQNDYANRYYQPVNPPLDLTNPLNPASSGNTTITDPDRWQPLELGAFIDQSGNPIPGTTPPALSPEWGKVVPFSLTEDDLTVYERDGEEYWVYHDPRKPALINSNDPDALPEEYKWGHTLVAVWSSHLDPTDGVMWDISPGCIGDSPPLPITITGLRDFYDLEDGNRGGNDGTGNCAYAGSGTGTGHPLNPATGQPYRPQVVPRGDYTRVLAEFWADGPDSETPPGHWFTILNHAVNDHPQFEKRFAGAGPVLGDLEWDVKAYFLLGGAVHDAAVAAWGIKGWYDYVRPVSAVRYMAERGQSSDPSEPNYNPNGLPLIPGYVEIVRTGDPLSGASDENVGEIKIRAWRGHLYIDNPATDTAGVGWVLAKDWWPYQRPTFVTPPFAGYISGHSTFSRTAAEALTLLTGSEYFPGGMAVFEAPRNEFLVFEEGPSVDVTLQWATYRDASDQTSLSRIWGSIHPPVDDIPGRLIGIVLGPQAFAKAETYFDGTAHGSSGGGSMGWALLLSAALGLFCRQGCRSKRISG